MRIDRAYIKKFAVMFVAILGMGFTLSFLIEVNWGLDPASFCNKSISSFVGLTLGTWQIIIYAAMLMIVIILDRHLIGAGTIVNMVMIGYTADFCCFIWDRIIPNAIFTDKSFLLLKTVIFIISVSLFVITASIYMNAEMGLSPYDAIPKVISNHLKGIPYAAVRIAYDITVVGLGVLFCAKRNPRLLHSLPGALIMAVSLGPTISAVGRYMKRFMTLSSPAS